MNEPTTAASRPFASEAPLPRSAERPFRLVSLACLQFVVLTALAMLVYAGGTVADPSTTRYQFFHNFFSDLGRTQTRLGAPNTLSAVLFFVALALAGLGLVLFFAAVLRFFRRPAAARALALVGTVAGVVSGLSFAGIALTPANLLALAHGLFVQWAFLAFLAAVLFYIPAVLLARDYPKRYAAVFAAFALLLAAYVWLLFNGPRPGSASGLVVQATGQKIIVYAAIVTAFIQAEGARRLARRAP